MAETNELAIQKEVLAALRGELGPAATWRDLSEVLSVNPVRISQWRSTKGMRLQTLIELLSVWNVFAANTPGTRQVQVQLKGGANVSMHFR